MSELFLPPHWLVLASGQGVWLPSHKPCRCGNPIKLVSQSEVYCARCVKPKPEERVVGWIGEDGVYHEGQCNR